MLSAAALAGCTKAEILPEVPGNVLLSVSATIPESLTTKSYGDGGTADILYAEAYTHDSARNALLKMVPQASNFSSPKAGATTSSSGRNARMAKPTTTATCAKSD